MKDIDETSHHRKTLQEQVVKLVFSSVLAKREFGQCRRLYLITIIILLVQISCTS